MHEYMYVLIRVLYWAKMRQTVYQFILSSYNLLYCNCNVPVLLDFRISLDLFHARSSTVTTVHWSVWRRDCCPPLSKSPSPIEKEWIDRLNSS